MDKVEGILEVARSMSFEDAMDYIVDEYELLDKDDQLKLAKCLLGI